MSVERKGNTVLNVRSPRFCKPRWPKLFPSDSCIKNFEGQRQQTPMSVKLRFERSVLMIELAKSEEEEGVDSEHQVCPGGVCPWSSSCSLVKMPNHLQTQVLRRNLELICCWALRTRQPYTLHLFVLAFSLKKCYKT